MRRLFALTAAVFVLAGFSIAPASATALPLSSCTRTSGTILAVDFGRWGGPVLRACGTSGGTGYQLMNEGGWSTEGTQHDGPAFICRIGYSGFQGGTQYPTASDEACVLTPPANAYWSYWLAPAGQNTWSYSQLGAMSYHPKPGEVEAWVFGATDVNGTQGQPSFSPESVRPPADQPAPPGGSGGGGTGGGSSGGGSGGSGPAKPVNPPASPGPTTGPTTTTTTPAPTSSSTGPTTTSCPTTPSTSSSYCGAGTTSAAGKKIENAEPALAVQQSAGSPLPVIIGGALVLVIAAAGGFMVWRRRNS